MKTILVIEDTPAMRENIAEILQLAPYTVIQAANGKEGIELARQNHPDLILCDIRMPELDGLGVLHILRKDPVLADVPFIFLTAKADRSDFRHGMNLGADDYLTKPFDDLTLLNAVAIRLGKSQRGQPDIVATQAHLLNLAQAMLGDTNAGESLCDYFPTTNYNRKHCLFTAGSWPTALYFIGHGKGKLSRADVIGNQYITGLYGAGDFVGYLALLNEGPYAETAELLEDSTVCTIPRANFISLLHYRQDIANRFTRRLADETTDLQERLLKLAYQSVRKRVAEALLLYQRKFYPRVGESGTFARPEGQSSANHVPGNAAPSPTVAMTLSRENWAHLVGASTETVIRILGDLRDEGLIEIQASQITLLDIDKLALLKR